MNPHDMAESLAWALEELSKTLELSTQRLLTSAELEEVRISAANAATVARNLEKPSKKDIIDMDALTPAQRRRVELAVHPHDTVFSRRYPREWIDAWERAAQAETKNLREWVAEKLNAAAKRKI